MNIEGMRAAVDGTAGVVRRSSTTIMLIDGSAPTSAELLTGAATLDGAALQALWRAKWSDGGLPSMAVITRTGGDVIAMLSGDVTMQASTQFGTVESRPQGGGLHEQPLQTETLRVVLRLGPEGANQEIAVSDEDLLDLTQGTVRGSIVALSQSADAVAPPAPVTPTPPAATPAATPAPAPASQASSTGQITGGAVLSQAFHETLTPAETAPPAAPEAPPAVAAPAPALTPPPATPTQPPPTPTPPPPTPTPPPATPPPATPTPPPPTPTPPPATPTPPPPTPDFEPIDLAAPADVAPAPLPVAPEAASEPQAERGAEAAPAGDGDAPATAMVLGVRCPVDHHNHPDAHYCSQCGRKLGVNLTSVLLQGPRPPLGLFVLDDGSTISIDGDMVIGRDPTAHDAVIAGTASSVVIPDDSLGISRHHAMIVLDGWDVTVMDLASSNGTYVQKSGQTNWEQVRGNTPLRLEMGDTVKVPGREMRLELHHIAS